MQKNILIIASVLLVAWAYWHDSHLPENKDYAHKNTNYSVKNTKKTININDLIGNLNYQSHADFVNVDIQYAKHTQFYLRKEVYEKMIEMFEAAKKENISLKIGSAGRTFQQQKEIWESKWKTLGKLKTAQEKALNILQYSAMPTTSRHHWGTDIDINAKSDDYFLKGKGKQEYEWLQKNAAKFGFYQPYTAQNEARPNGYKEEKWHWSYMPLASKFLDSYKKNVTNAEIKGFLGAETAEKIEVINKYVFGISQECLNYKEKK